MRIWLALRNGFVFITLMSSSNLVMAQDADDLAKKLANPVAAMISVPFQFNYDGQIGPVRDGSRAGLNIQPVIPFRINEDWNLISRTIIPIISQREIFPGAGHQAGVGDIIQSFFFSPSRPTSGGIIWGVGPVFQLRTGNDPFLGQGQWGGGITGVVLKQIGPWTIGALGNHVWSASGNALMPYVNRSFIQPFVSYALGKGWTASLNTETTFDWRTHQWSVPLNASISKLLVINKQPISIGLTGKYWAVTSTGGPHGWGARLSVTFLFPTGK